MAKSLNVLAAQANAEVLIFIDPNIRKLTNESLIELAGFASQKEIGAVGAKISDANGNIKHGGIILGMNNLLGFAHRNFSVQSAGNFLRAQVINNFSAVSGVLAIRKDVFEENNGFDETCFNQGLYEIDLCLRLLEKGLRIVFNPYAEFIQTGTTSLENILNETSSDEIGHFQEKWKYLLESDRFYNENLSLINGNFSIQYPPRIKTMVGDLSYRRNFHNRCPQQLDLLIFATIKNYSG